MTEPYLITFTPVDRFFFGSSRSFSEGFYVVSMHYPQPTTVMGCLRHTLLMQNGLITPDRAGRFIPDIKKPEIQKLTGTCTMEILTDDNDNFGIIEKISPPFIVQRNGETQKVRDFLFPIPGDVQLKDRAFNYITYEKIATNAHSWFTLRRLNYAIKSTKDPKIYPVPYLGGEQFWKDYYENKTPPFDESLKEATIIIENKSVGIGRKNRITQSGLFYTKRDLTLKKTFSFGIIAWLKEGDKLKEGIVVLGGERSVFKLEIKKLDELDRVTSHPLMNAILTNKTDFVSLMKGANSKSKIIALSPALVDISVHDALEHGIINDIKTMRMLKPQSNKKSDSVCMIPECSVLYPSGSCKPQKEYKIPYKIGYNYAISLLNQGA